MGEVSGGLLSVAAPLKAAQVDRHNEIKYRPRNETWSRGLVQPIVDLADGGQRGSGDVAGLCAYDLETDQPSSVWCLLLSSDEGIVLTCEDQDSRTFSRVGIFWLERKDWYSDCEPVEISII
jgi:hypothetical protein